MNIKTKQSIPPPELIERLYRQPLKYSTVLDIFYCIQVDQGCFIGVFGDGDNGAYEWFDFAPGKLETSNCAYGQAEIALRDVLLRFHPLLPEN